MNKYHGDNIYIAQMYDIIRNGLRRIADYSGTIIPQPSINSYECIRIKINEFFERDMKLCNYAHSGQSISHWLYKHSDNVYYIALIGVDLESMYETKHKLYAIYKASQNDIKDYYNSFCLHSESNEHIYFPGPYEILPKI